MTAPAESLLRLTTAKGGGVDEDEEEEPEEVKSGEVEEAEVVAVTGRIEGPAPVDGECKVGLGKEEIILFISL